MPDESSLLITNRSALVNDISHYAYKAIVALQERQPELLNEKYRVSWRSSRYRSAFIAKLTDELRKTQNWDELLLKVKKFLQVLLTPKGFASPILMALLEKIGSLNQIQTNSSDANGLASVELENGAISPQSINVSAPLFASESIISLQERGIAILLLDVENLKLNIETEKFLSEVCTYPIQIKVAFANWRMMGKQDAEFHARGYELIHVPAGKDSADVKMATVGSSIFVHYPTAREVLVCSSDNVLTHLCTTLQTHGLTVYLVRKQGEAITVLNSKTGQTQIYPLRAVELPSVEELIVKLKALIKLEQARTNSQWVKLSRISNLFQTKYKLTINQIVSTHFPGKRAKDIFWDRPADFAVHQLPEQSQLYVTLFELPQLNQATSNHSVQLTETKTQEQAMSSINSSLEVSEKQVSR